MSELLLLELSLTPSNVVVDVAKKIFSPPHSMAGTMITNTIGNLAASTLFGGYSWPVRWLLRTATRNLASNLIVKNIPTTITIDAMPAKANEYFGLNTTAEIFSRTFAPHFSASVFSDKRFPTYIYKSNCSLLANRAAW